MEVAAIAVYPYMTSFGIQALDARNLVKRDRFSSTGHLKRTQRSQPGTSYETFQN
ncbi:MAG: hypothetical protein GY744_03760 [Gammaproteobacteria bacterium]|nr:hypothetical protein [Gammaproteobacteria bacterium]